MNPERLGTPTQFAERLAAHLAVPLGGADLPEPAELVALVEATFYASLHEEEARRHEFSLAWQPAALGCHAIVAITRPVVVTPKNLAKLAPATRHEATSIAVRREGDALLAWALLEHGATARQPLTIRVLASGVLRIDHEGTPRALYARGEMYFLGGDYAVRSASETLTRTFGAWSADADRDVDLRAAVVTRLAARMLDHGHGGMLLVIPAAVATPSGVRVHYDVGEGANMLVTRYEQVLRDVPAEQRLERLRGSRWRDVGGRVRVRDEAQIAFAEAIEFVARLSAIDNAVLLDTDLRIRGFGVQVLAGEAPQIAFEHADPYADDVHVDDLSTFKGTRHPAGVIFCMRQEHEAAAIIASQDGRLSLAVKHAGGGVEVVGSYERAFGWI